MATRKPSKASAQAPSVPADDLAVEFDPLQMSAALGDLASPAAVGAEMPRFMAELAAIAVGASDIEIPERDKRFADPGWRQNPIYRRIGQSYLAWADLVDRLADNPA